MVTTEPTGHADMGIATLFDIQDHHPRDTG
jgi:hypothetical protein